MECICCPCSYIMLIRCDGHCDGTLISTRICAEPVYSQGHAVSLYRHDRSQQITHLKHNRMPGLVRVNVEWWKGKGNMRSNPPHPAMSGNPINETQFDNGCCWWCFLHKHIQKIQIFTLAQIHSSLTPSDYCFSFLERFSQNKWVKSVFIK